MKKSKKVGRPALPKRQQLKPLQIRMSDDQRAAAEKAARKQRKPLGTFARDVIIEASGRINSD